MKILVTGAAGFIGHALVKALAANPEVQIVGLDNINDYYDPRFKFRRLIDCGINKPIEWITVKSSEFPNYHFVQMDLTDRNRLNILFAEERFTHVVNLAGQAGVRYSIKNPYAYVESNVMGFLNVLECCRHYGVKKLLYASSSSVYGEDAVVPFQEYATTDYPVSLYAATKKSDEVMAYAYSKLYGFTTIGLRFFTVYGPWGRPDMAPIKFMKAIMNGSRIEVYGRGHLYRDFTYIGDIVKGIMLILDGDKVVEGFHGVPSTVYNIGCGNPVLLLDFIETIERVTGKEATKIMCGMQPGDVTCTYADSSRLERDYGYKPSTTLQEGIAHLYDWYCQFVEKS